MIIKYKEFYKSKIKRSKKDQNKNLIIKTKKL